MPPKRAAAKRKTYSEASDDEDFEQTEGTENTEPPKKKVKSTNLGEWKDVEDGRLLIFTPKEVTNSKIVASFDFDDTLVKTKSGKAFANNASDWQLWCDKVKPKLAELHKKGERIVIFTNQNGIAKGNLTIDALHGRINQFMEEVGVPIQVYAATSEDHFRKPATGMWDYFSAGLDIDISKSYYVGDAAGRPKAWNGNPKKKKDHSCGDRKFALNVGMSFFTPEEFFDGDKPCETFSWDGMDIKSYIEKLGGAEKFKNQAYKAEDLIKKTQEVVIFCGYPASGKSTFAKKYFIPNGYVHVNRDTLSTPAKCLKATKEALAAGKSVVIDNTNPDAASRAQYIEAAQEYKVPVRAFVFKTDFDLSQHLNYVRQAMTKGVVKHVPDVAYHTYKKKMQPVTKDEGISEIKEIEFIPDLSDTTTKQYFLQFT